MSAGRAFRARVVATLMILLCALALTPAPASAQALNGTIYAADGASIPVLFAFSVSGQTFVAFIITFGQGGHGRWFAAVGNTDGVSGTGELLSPVQFTVPTVGSMQFQLDPGGATGSFSTQGLEGLLSLPAGRLVRFFP
jgi:hypothetical protein